MKTEHLQHMETFDMITSWSCDHGNERDSTMAKRSKVYTGSKVNGVITLTFDDAAKTVVSVDTTMLPDNVKAKAIVHGVYQKLIDSGAGKEIDEFIRKSGAIARNLIRGKWNDSGLDESLLAEAISAVTGKPLAAVEENVFAATDEQMKKWAEIPTVAAKMQEIEAKRMNERANASKADDKKALLEDFA